MDIKSSSQASLHKNSEYCIIRAYPTTVQNLDGAIADITGRYPDSGFVLNEAIHELAYVVRGQGALLTKDGSHALQTGDIVSISPGEAFAWDGDMTLFIACSPKFDPGQYKNVC